MNYYQFHIGDYISHTHHLSNEEDLTYRRMLDFYYQSEKPFNDEDVEKIAKRVKSHPEIVTQILEEFFEYDVSDYCWHNKRADAEIAKYHLKSDSARKANQKRWGSEDHLKSDLKSDADQILTNNQEPITNNHKKEYIDRFDIFWKQYPRKVAKPNALKSWLKIKPDDVVLKKMLAAINHQGLPSREIQFVPHPASWLNAQRWEDEITAPANNGMTMERRVL